MYAQDVDARYAETVPYQESHQSSAQNVHIKWYAENKWDSAPLESVIHHPNKTLDSSALDSSSPQPVGGEVFTANKLA